MCLTATWSGRAKLWGSGRVSVALVAAAAGALATEGAGSSRTAASSLLQPTDACSNASSDAERAPEDSGAEKAEERWRPCMQAA